LVTNNGSSTISTIDVKTGIRNPADITVGGMPFAVAVAPDGKTAFVANLHRYVSTIDVKTGTRTPLTSQSAGLMSGSSYWRSPNATYASLVGLTGVGEN